MNENPANALTSASISEKEMRHIRRLLKKSMSFNRLFGFAKQFAMWAGYAGGAFAALAIICGEDMHLVVGLLLVSALLLAQHLLLREIDLLRRVASLVDWEHAGNEHK